MKISEKKLSMAMVVLCFVVGGLAFINALFGWIGTGAEAAYYSSASYAAAGGSEVGYILGSILVVGASLTLIGVGSVFLLNPKKLYVYILIAAAAVSNIMFASLIGSLLTVVTIVALIVYLVIEGQPKEKETKAKKENNADDVV